jgi:hypothetical protein
MKVVTIEATFPELKIKNMYQQGRGRGSTLQAALGAATRDLLKQKGLKAKRFTMFKATFSVGTVQEVAVPDDVEVKKYVTEG